MIFPPSLTLSDAVSFTVTVSLVSSTETVTLSGEVRDSKSPPVTVTSYLVSDASTTTSSPLLISNGVDSTISPGV
ncbi:hypothetical protein FCV83_24560 [Enterovibrio norvegicus]|nr:hypothetical protein FCV83_24560 [Enterovibrio norvegicus]